MMCDYPAGYSTSQAKTVSVESLVLSSDFLSSLSQFWGNKADQGKRPKRNDENTGRESRKIRLNKWGVFVLYKKRDFRVITCVKIQLLLVVRVNGVEEGVQRGIKKERDTKPSIQFYGKSIIQLTEVIHGSSSISKLPNLVQLDYILQCGFTTSGLF